MGSLINFRCFSDLVNMLVPSTMYREHLINSINQLITADQYTKLLITAFMQGCNHRCLFLIYGHLAARAQFLNGTVLDHSCGCQVVVYISQQGMAISFAAISNFFADEIKLIERAENALKSNRLHGFTLDGLNGVIKATVGASMKRSI